jgi:hypothetical protein
MKILLGRAWLLAAATWCAALPAGQFSEMVQGLRERQYYDYALLYLDQLSANPNVPSEVRQEIPYEKAMVLLDQSKTVRSPEKQTELLDQAQSYLEQFAKENPNHPRAGEANSQRAEILLGKARVATRGEFQTRARGLIEQARKVFETARDQHEAAWQSYGTFINQEKEPEKYEAREQALMQLIASMLNVCQCRYEEAQTYDAGTPEFKRLLNQAADEFELLYQRYRNYTGGLYARLYQAKCFDDQGDTQKAMGIYNELLGHEGSNRNLRKLQNLTLQFKLEALNRKTPPDSQVVVDLAAEWLKENKAVSRSQVGLAIQWEQAVAYEALGDQRDAAKSDKERNWRTARTIAQLVNRFPSVYRDVSLAMIQRLDTKLGGRDRKPADFDAAFGLAKQSFLAIQDLRKELEASGGKPAEEVRKLEQDLQQQMHDAAEMFQLAINLADRGDDPKSVATARLWLAYVHFWARRNYEAAILADYVARTAPKDDSTLAIDAAYLAMAAFVQAFNDAQGTPEQKAADLGFIVRSCEVLTNRWPESDRANDARMMAGRMYSLAKKPVEAAAWFSQVPEADARFAEAQLAAGQAFWRGYLSAARLPQDQRPSAEQMQLWQTLAQQHLRTGMAKLSATISTEGTTPLDLVSAKVSLAEILISQGQEGEAIPLLTADPHSVTRAIAVADESQRPAGGVQSRTFAVEVYKLLLRAYIGNGRLDEARATMKTLESVAGGGPAGGDITELYVGLGKLLKEELERIRDSGHFDRFAALRNSFETFLNDVYQRKEGHSFGTLSWVGETYAALGEAEPEGSLEAATRFDKAAAAFREILAQAQGNSGFATTDQLLAVQVRLAHCLRMKKDFATAEKLIAELLQQRNNDLKLQMEAALLYQDWAAEPGEETRYLLAISGNTENQALGFGPLSRRIQNALRASQRPDLLEAYFETRYHTSLSRFKYALAQKSPKDRRRELDKAELEIVAFAAVTKDVPDQWREKFNDLFRDVRAELADEKRPVQDLEFGGDVDVDVPAESTAETRAVKPPAAGKKAAVAPAKVSPINPLLTYGLLGVGVALGIGIVVLMFVRGNKRHRPLLKSTAAAPLSFDLGDVPAPAARGPATFPTAKPPATKTAARTASATAAKEAKPRPKPPRGT